MAECNESQRIDEGYGGGPGGILACWLPADHDGPHYDLAENLSWHEGRPYDWPEPDDPPEYDPDLAESQRIGEDFDQAATDYARIQAEED